jgi:ABC-type sugar transport system ATPase subunit
MTPFLQMIGIGKDFSGVRVLDRVSFDLRRGEVHVLAGENGAGKSTLMKILSGVHTGYEGGIRLEGQPVLFSSPQDAVARGISMIHQELSLIESLSAVDNIFLGRERVFTGGWIRRRVQIDQTQALFRRLDLDVDLHRPIGEFSLPVRQMIEIARALAFDARLLIMDEPTSSLNEPEVIRLFALIRELRRTCAIVYISHKMDEIYQLADRITVLRDGRHIITADAGAMPQNELVRHLVGRELGTYFPVRQKTSGAVAVEVNQASIPSPPDQSRIAVQNISFTAHAGEIVGFAGLQGSGNSELFQGLFGVYGRALQGAIAVEGRPYSPRSPRHAIASRIALLTHDRKGTGLIPDFSTGPNITLASLRNVSAGGWMRPGRERELAGRYRQDFNIRLATMTQAVCELSGGNQQKVVLAKWLETRPRLLLLDEPTRGVDVGAKHEIYEWINRWTADGMCILLITSELPELLALSDRILVMHRGTIRAEFSRAEATQGKIIQAAMGEDIRN